MAISEKHNLQYVYLDIQGLIHSAYSLAHLDMAHEDPHTFAHSLVPCKCFFPDLFAIEL